MKHSTPKIKFCGITRLEDARFAAGAMADYLGFIFYEGSKRYIDPAQAGAIINWIEGPEKVGVFVNQPLDVVNDIARTTGLDIVQLHGDESPEYCDLIQKPVIKAVHVTEDRSAVDVADIAKMYIGHVDYLLFDNRAGGQWGGTGSTFDWTKLETFSEDIPFFLSGGLNAENILEAARTLEPFALDISSGIEEVPGIKDFDKIIQLMDKVMELHSDS